MGKLLRWAGIMTRICDRKKLPKLPKMPKIKDVNHFIKKKELQFQDIAKLIWQVSRLLPSRKPTYKPTGWKVFIPHSLTPET